MEEAAMPYEPDEAEDPVQRSRVEHIRHRYEDRLMSIEGVVGVEVASDSIGEQVIRVFLRDASSGHGVPTMLEGVPVETEVTGDIDAQ